MASSQVEIAAASSPFGCVLRDHNRRDGCNRDFRKNIKDLVRDHLHTCLPDDNASSHKPIVTNNDNDSTNTNTNYGTDRLKLRPLCGSNGINRDRDGQEFSSSSPLTPRQARGFDRWAPQQAGDMVSSTMEIPSPSPSYMPNLQSQSECGSNNSGVGGGASSLVQMWEARLNRSMSINKNNNINITINITHNNVNHINGSSRSNSSSSVSSACSRSPKSNASANIEDLSRVCDSELCDRMVTSEDPSPPPSSSSSIADSAGIGGGGEEGEGGQKQKVRVADIIRRLTTSDNDHDTNGSNGSPSVLDHMETQRGFVPVVSSPRIRGRQAFSDLLMQMERDRHRELDSLSDRRAVSQFSHKGRIQSMLKLRLLQRGMANRDQQRLVSGASGGNSSPHNSSVIMHLRERFSTATENDLGDQNHPVEPRSLPRHPPLKNSCAMSTQPQNSHSREDNPSTIEHSCATPISSSARPIEDLRNEANPTSNTIDKDGASLGSSNGNLELEQPAVASRALHEQASQASAVSCEDNRRVESSNRNLELEQPTETSRALHEQASQASAVVSEGNRRVQRSNSNLEIQQTTAVFSPLHEVASSTSDAMPQGTSSDARNGNNLELQRPADALSSLHEEATLPPSAINQGTSFEGCNRDNVQAQTATDALASLSVWYEDEIAEEQDTDNANEEEEWYRERGGSYDWFSDICRPRSYWEDRRQEWYREMLAANSVNEEIRQLIERGRVSSFLSSDFRERMDDLMTSRLQRQTQLGHQEEEQDDLSSQERVEQLMSSLLQGHEHPIGNRQGDEEREELGQQEEEEEEGNASDGDEQGYIIEDEEDNGNGHEGENDEEMEDDEEVEGQEEEEEDEEGGSVTGHQYHEASDYFDQTTSSFYMPSQSLRSWSFNDNEMNDDHDQVASTSSDRPPRSHSYYQDPQQHSNCMDNLSVEMELIIDLRGQMTQLQREMSELRKSIKSCMEMQMTLQGSMKQEMSSVCGDAARSVDKIPRKGNCCICYEKQVDSLLYRCGHMCACLKCAHELQWSSGKCPICRAPIVDVVRAYPGS